MKRILLFLMLCCGIIFSVAGQGKFLKTLKRGVESVTGIQISDEPVFVYPEIGAWKMSLVSCDGNAATGEVVLRIKAMPLLQSPGAGVNGYLLHATDANRAKLKVGPWGSANRYDFPLLTNTEITFQPLMNVPRTTETIHVRFVIGIEVANNTFELRNVPVNWLSVSTTTTVEKETVTTVRIVEERTDTITTIVPGGTEWTKVETPAQHSQVITGGGYDIERLRTSFFYFENPDGSLEVVDIDLFDPDQFVYSLTIGLKNKRFPVERAYEKLGDIVEDVRTKDYYMKHMAKCFVLAEKGKTSIPERETIAENYLYLAINKFVNDNADNGLYLGDPDLGGVKVIPRTKLVEEFLGAKLNTKEEIIKTLDDGEKHILDYISAHPPKKSRIAFMGDNQATQQSFEYRFYDQEMFLHAFVFSPITLHYEIRSWYDDVSDVTVYAYFYCVGYDNEGMEQTLGAKDYESTKKDFKTRNNLDFDAYPLQCLMMGFEDQFKLIPNPPVVKEINFAGHVSWFPKKQPSQVKTTVKKTAVVKEVTKKETEKYTVSPNSAAYLSGMNILYMAEDNRYTYLAGTIASTSKLITIEKSSGKITEIYTTTHGNKGDKGDIRRLMADNNGGVLVEFSKYPAMTCRNAVLTDTKLHIRANDQNLMFYYPKLKAVMPNGDVLLIENAMGNQNTLVDPEIGTIKAYSKEMSFNDQMGRTAVTNDGVIWEPGPDKSYTLVAGLGTAAQPTFTKLDTGYDSQFKGGIDEIKIAPDGSLYIASGAGLHKTSDGGKTWLSTKNIDSYGNFKRIAPNNLSEVWASTSSSQGHCIVKYDQKLTKIQFRVSEFDVTDQDGKKIKLQTNPRILFSDSAGNLWIVGGTYGKPGVLIFNPGGINGYSEVAEKKAVVIQ